jgi:cyclic pyranopterin phosphate synthase
MSAFTHFDAKGNAVMVDIAEKAPTHRIAMAKGRVSMARETQARIAAGDFKKGDVLGVARLAGIMAAKKTADLIPLCHPLALTKARLDFALSEDPNAPGVEIEATVNVTGQTGVEMEALTAVTVAALTLYDMCKAVDKTMRIEAVRVTRKEGGRSGTYEAD